MVSLNPFKKKEENNSFSLDEEQLPSLSQMNQSQDSQQINSQNPMGQSQQDFGQNSMPQFDNQQNQNNDFSTNPFANQSSMQPQDLSQPSNIEGTQGSNNKNEDNKYMNDYSKAKLESIDSKVALLEAKFSSIEQKMDALLSIVSEEVSEDTKSKLKLNSMLDTLKQKQQQNK